MLSSYFFVRPFIVLKRRGGGIRPPPNGSHPVKQPNVTRVKDVLSKVTLWKLLIFKQRLLFQLPQLLVTSNRKTQNLNHTPTLSFPCSVSTHFSSALLTPNCHSIFIFSLIRVKLFLVKWEKNVGTLPGPPPGF